MPTSYNPKDSAVSLTTNLDQVYEHYQDLLEEIEEFGETVERLEQLSLVQAKFLELASDASEFMIDCTDMVQANAKEAERLKEKAAAIAAQAKRHEAKADWIKSLMTWYLQANHPNGIKTDLGKFGLRKSQSVSVLPETTARFKEFNTSFEEACKDILYGDKTLSYEAIDQFKDLAAYGVSRLKVSIEPDKSAMANILKSGPYPGFELVEKVSINIPKARKSKAS
jgi:hypothetical protein